MTTSAFLAQWTSSFVPNLISNSLQVAGLLLGLSMAVGYAILAVKASS